MEQVDAKAIAFWRYPDPFSFYDWAADPDDLAELLDAESRGDRYFAVDDETGDLVGFFSFKPRPPALELGLGLAPARTGQGLGEDFVRAGLDYAWSRFAPEEFVLSVARFNRRAITVYERAGFEPVRVFMHRTNGRDWEFVEMRRPA